MRVVLQHNTDYNYISVNEHKGDHSPALEEMLKKRGTCFVALNYSTRWLEGLLSSFEAPLKGTHVAESIFLQGQSTLQER